MEFEKNVFEAIYRRRSIRNYQDRKVEKEKIIRLLKAGMAAPSACNLQPWEFIVVTDGHLLSRIRETSEMGNYNAPLAVVVCANTANIPWGGESWMIDCGAAVENMMLAAVAMGLGSVWIGSHDETVLRELLAIPDGIQVMNVVYFGYPADEKKPGTRYNEEAVYWEKYDPERKRALRTVEMLSDLSVKDP